MVTTPKQIIRRHKHFATLVAPGGKLHWLSPNPRPGAAVKNCFPNVAKHVEKNGGSIQHGWLIWECRNFLEAEFHGVWLSPEGELVDVTPPVDGENRILFLTDPVRRFAGKLVPNRIYPLSPVGELLAQLQGRVIVR